ncbi:hypothetical protein [Peterkaempfera sp. SMS 1(5)a]|uniref:hypothetical protein n=1 Tax=Peterkaempfera podocarpi TaxID=3232308 RepID=UPI0036729C30
MTVDIEAARTFIRTNARIIEQRLAEFHLDGDATAAAAAIAGLEAYRNRDGGFGHGLEPDALAPDSQPLAVDSAFGILDEVARSTSDPSIRMRAADAARVTMPYLDSVSSADGGLSIVFPSVAAHPRADHWGDGVFAPGLNPTSKIVGIARTLGVEHPWLDRAAAFCRAAIDTPESVGDAHTAICVLPFLETDADRAWAAKASDDLRSRITELPLFKEMPGPDYGLSPLDFAESPESPRRELFSDVSIAAHLDDLAAGQQDDGGWPLGWEPPGHASVLAWRGAVTLHALRVLRAYGRIAR